MVQQFIDFKTKILAIATLKGGPGKTTTAQSVAGILAERGNKVLVIDIDPQGNLTSNLGVDEFRESDDSSSSEEDFEMLDLQTSVKMYEDPKCIASSIIIKAPVEELPTLDIIPGSILLTATELKINSQAGREFILRNFFKRNVDTLREYDYIIFDTNPYMSIVNQNAYVICDHILLTTSCGMNSLRGLKLFRMLWGGIRELLDLDDNIEGILITKFDKRVGLQREFVDYMEEQKKYENLLFKTIIPINSRLEVAEAEFKPINVFDKSSTGYKAYNNFVDELLERIGRG